MALPRGIGSLREERQGIRVLWLPGRQGSYLCAALRAAGRIAGRRISVLAFDRPGAGALAFRHHDTARARTLQGGSRSRLLHASGRCGRAEGAARRRDQGAIAPWLYPYPRRNARARQAATRAGVCALVRRSATDQQGDAGRHRSDLVADRLQEMRRAHREGVTMMTRNLIIAALAIALVAASGPLLAQVSSGLRGATPLNVEGPAAPMPPVRNTAEKEVRNYPEQPPVIPHTIDGYQVDLNGNKCLSCHARARTAESQAPMVSITHFMDRDGQFLASVSPRRFFCTQCHVPQSVVTPPVSNDFIDIDAMLSRARPGGRR